MNANPRASLQDKPILISAAAEKIAPASVGGMNI
jgi:hypothetical protein